MIVNPMIALRWGIKSPIAIIPDNDGVGMIAIISAYMITRDIFSIIMIAQAR